ncbi:S9 family peptidase [Sphingobacterium lactis]|uniref:Dipeptidyl aminopeptidase/acylaminoacyl peptidase n=1 Tax=Sphingobacterium lactis TaxID=797291 RepID=A0A1H5WR46_9SPHI|nr:prolyl oligopeptidase family serine peptidase [Sphingobacterium lactis]SEG02002.1 Dipeptidyl aminopeptidase/acylaminoacyl peptidase [Sphingobacterium lactis]
MNLRILFSVLSCLLVLVSCEEKQSNQKIVPIEDFFVKPERTSFKLSPDGSKIAYLGEHDHCKNIFILDLQEPDSSKQLTYQVNLNVQHFFWLDEQRIIFSNTQSSADSLRLFHIDIKTEKRQALLKPEKAKLRWVGPIKAHNGSLLVGMNSRDSSLFDLYRVFLDGRPKELVAKNPGNVMNWIGSPDGVVRIALTSDSVQETLLYRRTERDPFKEVMVNDFETLFYPIGFVKGSTDHIYAFSNRNRDRMALVEFDASTGQELRNIHENKRGDLSIEGYSHNLQEMVYVSSFADKYQKEVFNASYREVYQELKKKFKDSEISFLDVDKQQEGFVVRVFSDIHAGETYYYNRRTKVLDLLNEENPKLKNIPFNPMEEVEFLSRDNKNIHAYITYPKGQKKNIPVVVLVHDGPNRRAEWGFDPEVQFLANRGYAVFQVNYRGSIGYGKDFWSAGFKEWGGKIQSDITDGVAWLIHQGIADKNRIAIMGTGFGGYSALYAAAFNPSLYKCAISSSGYSNLFTYFREIPPHLKHYVQLFYRIIGNPESESELFQSISPIFHADKVRIPVLFFQGGLDKYSSVTDANQFVGKLKGNGIPVRYFFKKDEGKRFKNEENIVEYYMEIENFLGEYLK